MGWGVVAKIGPGDDADGLYPAISDALELVRDPLDGPSPHRLPGRPDIEVQRDGAVVARAADLKIDVDFTASRLTLYCKKWATGGFIGSADPIGLAVAATTALVSSAIAAHRRSGTVLAGHIRWEWIAAIGWKPKTWIEGPSVIIRCLDATEEVAADVTLTMTLHRAHDAQALARSLVERVIAYRYSSDEQFSDSESSAWESIRIAGASPKVDQGVSWVTFPSSWPVGATGYPAPGPPQ